MNNRNVWERGRGGRIIGQGSTRSFGHGSDQSHDRRLSISYDQRNFNRGPQRPYDQGPNLNERPFLTFQNSRGFSRGGNNHPKRGRRGHKRQHWESGFPNQEGDKVSLQEGNQNKNNAIQRSGAPVDSNLRRSRSRDSVGSSSQEGTDVKIVFSPRNSNSNRRSENEGLLDVPGGLAGPYRRSSEIDPASHNVPDTEFQRINDSLSLPGPSGINNTQRHANQIKDDDLMTQEEINRKFHQLGSEAQRNFVKNTSNTSGLRRYEVGRSQERNQPSEISQSTQQQNDSSICTCGQNRAILQLIKEEIEKVRSSQENEEKRLKEEKEQILKDKTEVENEKINLDRELQRLQNEKEKLQKAKIDLKKTVDDGVLLLQKEKSKMEGKIREIEAKKVENELSKLRVKISELETSNQNKEMEIINLKEEFLAKEMAFQVEIEQQRECKELLEVKVKDLERVKTVLPSHKEQELEQIREDNRTIKNELEALQNKIQATESLELELEMTKETLASLEIELDTLKKELNTDYKVFLKKRKTLPEKEENTKNSKIEEEKRIKSLNEELKKISLQRELLKKETEELKENIEELITRNNTLENQLSHYRESNQEQLLKNENKILNQKLHQTVAYGREASQNLEYITKERDELKHKLEDITKTSRIHENRLQEAFRDKAISTRLYEDKNKAYEEMRTKLKFEVRQAQEERNSCRQKLDSCRSKLTAASSELDACRLKLAGTNSEIETMKSKLLACNTEKVSLETELRSLQKENEAIKEFKSDLSSVNVELLKDSRLENQQLSAKLSMTQEEVSDLHAKLKIEKDRCQSQEESEKELKRKISTNQRKCKLLEKKIVKLEHTLEEKEEEMKNLTEKLSSNETRELAENRLHADDDFSNFDLGLESLLRAPLDIINQQIDDINILQSSGDDIEDNNEASIEVEMQQDVSSSPVHNTWCECVECDDIDYLHGFLHGQPYGIKEMMESLNNPSQTPAHLHHEHDEDPESCPIDENHEKEENETINLDDDSSDDNIQFSEDEIELVTEDLQIVGVSKYKH